VVCGRWARDKAAKHFAVAALWRRSPVASAARRARLLKHSLLSPVLVLPEHNATCCSLLPDHGTSSSAACFSGVSPYAGSSLRCSTPYFISSLYNAPSVNVSFRWRGISCIWRLERDGMAGRREEPGDARTGEEDGGVRAARASRISACFYTCFQPALILFLTGKGLPFENAQRRALNLHSWRKMALANGSAAAATGERWACNGAIYRALNDGCACLNLGAILLELIRG